jgi:hypothetical protein
MLLTASSKTRPDAGQVMVTSHHSLRILHSMSRFGGPTASLPWARSRPLSRASPPTTAQTSALHPPVASPSSSNMLNCNQTGLHNQQKSRRAILQRDRAFPPFSALADKEGHRAANSRQKQTRLGFAIARWSGCFHMHAAKAVRVPSSFMTLAVRDGVGRFLPVVKLHCQKCEPML